MFDKLSNLATARPVRVLIVTAVFFVLATVVGGPVAGLLNSDNDSFSDTNSESAQAIERIERASGLEAAPQLIVLIDTDNTEAIASARDILNSTDDVGLVVGGPEPGPAYVSRDGSQTFIAATYKASADDDAVTTALSDQLARVDGVTVGGFGPAFQQVNDQVEDDLIRAELLAFPLLFIAALFVFRSAVAALLPLLVGGLTIVSSLLILRGINANIDISIFALNLITGLGLGLAIDYSLFMVSRFREELERVGPGAEAVRRTVATAGRTVLFSALTVAGAGLALLVFPLRFLYSMGIGVTLVALVAAAVSLLVLPAVFAVLQTRVNSLALARWRRAALADARAESRGFWYRLSQSVMKHRIRTAVIGAAVLIALGAPFLGVKFTGVDASVLPDSASAKAVDSALRNDFDSGAASPLIIAVEAEERERRNISDYVGKLDELDHTALVTPARYLGDNLWQIEVTSDQPTLDQDTLSLVREVRDLDAPGQFWVGGVSADQVDQLGAIGDRLPYALLILTALTFIALFVMTGSVVLPIKALLMNLLTVSATFGILVLIFQHGRLEGLLNFESQGGLNSTQPVFLFAVAFGLSTDYAVFLLTRIKEARDGGAGDRESVALGIQRTGRIVTAAAILFAIALGAFATSEIVFIKQLGIGAAAAVLIDATIVRALLVPSLMALLGKANWWAPAPLRRLHNKIGLREG